jgi:hypothetical protein
MDLQTLSGKAVTSENALSPNNFRPYSPQTAAESRLQPDTAGAKFTLTHRTKTSSPTPQPQTIMVEIVRHLPPPTLKLWLPGWPQGRTRPPRPARTEVGARTSSFYDASRHFGLLLAQIDYEHLL